MERSLGLLLALVVSLVSTSSAHDFYVGGRNGWVLKPSENYSHWAERNRFQVNDKLVFKYKKGEDSVLVVEKEGFKSCNTTNPIARLDGGDSVFQLGRSGAFYFISGEPGNCNKGQKLEVVVLAARGKTPEPSPAPSPEPPEPPSSAAEPEDGSKASRVASFGVGVTLVVGLAFLN